MAERLFVDITPQGTLVAPTAQARAALARRSGRWVLMPSNTAVLLLSQWEGPEVTAVDGTERALLMGEMSGVGLLDLLGLLSQTRRNVRIVVSRGRSERAILLRDGDIASVASSDARDRLGEFLVRIGKLSAAQLQDTLNAANAAQRKLGQHLVAGGILSSHELWSAIQQQIMDIICDVVAWTEGTYAIFSLPDGFVWPQTPPLATQGIVLEAVRRADEMALFRHKIPSYDTLLTPTGKMPRDCTPTELHALQAVTPGVAMRDVGTRLQKGEFDTTKIMYGLMQKGAITVASQAPAPAVVPASVPPPAVVLGTVPFTQVPTVQLNNPLGGPQLGTALAPQQILAVFSNALREIDHELRRHGQTDAYHRGITAFLADRQNAYHRVFAGVALRQDGDVDHGVVLANAQAAGAPDPVRAVMEAMNELTFFALFQASELLESRVDEELARRVRTILGVLPR